MSFDFSQPAGASDWKAKDYVGHLIVFWARRLEQGIVTKYGPSDALRVDLVVLTNHGGPLVEQGVLLFQKPLVASLEPKIGGGPVLARLARGIAKGEQDAPYILEPFTAEDAAYAGNYMQSVGGNPFGGNQFNSPPQQTAPPVQHVPLPQQQQPAPVYAAAPVPAAPVYAPPVQQTPPAPVYQPQQAPQPTPVYQAAPQVQQPVQHQPPAAAMVTMPNGQVVTAETAAAAANLGMNFAPPPGA